MKNKSVNLFEGPLEVFDAPEGDIDVCGLSFAPSRIWQELDPTAFRVGCADYADSQVTDGEWQEVDGEFYKLTEVAAIQDELDQEEE